MQIVKKAETMSNSPIINVTIHNYGTIQNYYAPEPKKSTSFFSKIGAFLSIIFKIMFYIKPLLGFFVIGI